MKYFDLHCDTLSKLIKEGTDITGDSTAITLKKAEGLDTWCQCFAVWTPDFVKGDAAYLNYKTQVEKLEEQAALCSDKLVFCKTKGDIEMAVADNKCAGILTVENGSCIAGDLQKLPELKKDGVKIFSLTWNGQNELGSGASKDDSLSMVGRRAVVELNKLNITIDVSHIADKGFFDILNLTSKPIIATHSNSRALCNHPRNLTDEQFEAIVHTGGIVGMNFYTSFLKNGGKNAGIADLMNHIEHFLELGGEDNICLGSDFDGADMPAELADISFIPRLYDAMLAKGFTQKVAEKIMFDNAYSFAMKNFD